MMWERLQGLDIWTEVIMAISALGFSVQDWTKLYATLRWTIWKSRKVPEVYG
jgi:hypothetical protein